MKVKGISAFEQHVEKIAVGGAAVLLVGIGAWQLLVPSTVKVGNKEVPPSEVLLPIADAAKKVKDNVENPNPKLPEAPTVALSDAFKKKLAAGVAPRSVIAALGAPLNLAGKGDTNVADAIFALPNIPAPGVPVAHAFWCTVDPIEVVTDEKKEIAAILPSQQPFDKSAVSVEATFNGAELNQILDGDPDGDGPQQPIRRGWWDRTYIIGVEMEREELSFSGTWGKATVMSSIPGRSNPIKYFTENVKNPGDKDTAINMVSELGEEAYRTPFYRTISGTPGWVDPALAQGDGDANAGDSAKLVRDRVAIEASIERITKQLQDAGGNAPREGGGGGKGGGGRNVNPGSGGPNNPADPKQQQRQQLERRLATEQTRLDDNTKSLEKLGLGIDGKPLQAGAAVRKVEPALMKNPALKVWAHDVSATPGKSYRYRLRVVINNPFFGQAASLKDDQKSFAESVLLRGAWSPWGDTVTVDPQTQFFITSAAQQDVLRGPRATVEMFTFYYGYPRKAVVNVEPGDSLSGEVKLPENLMAFDLTKFDVPAGDPNAQPAADPGPDGGGAGKGGGGKGGGGGMRNPGGERADPAQPGDVADPNAPKVAGTPLPRDLKVKVDAMLMDVSAAVVGTSEAYRTLFRDGANGELFVRTPEDDRRSEVYRKLAKLAEVGRNQGQKPPEPVKKERPEIPTPPPAPPRQNPGGGGGGGGG